MKNNVQERELTDYAEERTRMGTNGQSERSHIGEDKHTMEKIAQGRGLTDIVRKERTI